LLLVVGVVALGGLDETYQEGAVELAWIENTRDEVVGEGLVAWLDLSSVQDERFEERAQPLRGELLLGQSVGLTWKLEVNLRVGARLDSPTIRNLVGCRLH